MLTSTVRKCNKQNRLNSSGVVRELCRCAPSASLVDTIVSLAVPTQKSESESEGDDAVDMEKEKGKGGGDASTSLGLLTDRTGHRAFKYLVCSDRSIYLSIYAVCEDRKKPEQATDQSNCSNRNPSIHPCIHPSFHQ